MVSDEGDKIEKIIRDELSERYDWVDELNSSFRNPSWLVRALMGLIFLTIQANLSAFILSIQSTLLENPIYLLSAMVIILVVINGLLLSQLRSGERKIQNAAVERAEQRIEEEKRESASREERQQKPINEEEVIEQNQPLQLTFSNFFFHHRLSELESNYEELQSQFSDFRSEYERENRGVESTLDDLDQRVTKNRNFVVRTYEKLEDHKSEESHSEKDERPKEESEEGESSRGHGENHQEQERDKNLDYEK